MDGDVLCRDDDQPTTRPDAARAVSGVEVGREDLGRGAEGVTRTHDYLPAEEVVARAAHHGADAEQDGPSDHGGGLRRGEPTDERLADRVGETADGGLGQLLRDELAPEGRTRRCRPERLAGELTDETRPGAPSSSP